MSDISGVRERAAMLPLPRMPEKRTMAMPAEAGRMLLANHLPDHPSPRTVPATVPRRE